MSSVLIEDINNCLKQISDHLLENQKTQLLGGNFYFKIDKTDNLVLLFATNIKIDKVNKNTNDNIEMRLKLKITNLDSFGINIYEDLPAVAAP